MSSTISSDIFNSVSSPDEQINFIGIQPDPRYCKEAEEILIHSLNKFNKKKFQFKAHKWFSLYPESLQTALLPQMKSNNIDFEWLKKTVKSIGHTFEPCEDHFLIAQQLINFQNSKIEKLLETEKCPKRLLKFKTLSNQILSNSNSNF